MRELTDGAGVDVVIEHIGEATWKASLQAARTGGRIVVCGATSGPNPPAQLHRIFWKQLSILGSTMGTREDFAAMLELVASGRAKPIVDQVFPLDDVRAAHARLESGEQLGKVVPQHLGPSVTAGRTARQGDSGCRSQRNRRRDDEHDGEARHAAVIADADAGSTDGAAAGSPAAGPDEPAPPIVTAANVCVVEQSQVWPCSCDTKPSFT